MPVCIKEKCQRLYIGKDCPWCLASESGLLENSNASAKDPIEDLSQSPAPVKASVDVTGPQQSDEELTSTEQQTESVMPKFCSSCGENLVSYDRVLQFCPNCGSSLGNVR